MQQKTTLPKSPQDQRSILVKALTSNEIQSISQNTNKIYHQIKEILSAFAIQQARQNKNSPGNNGSRMMKRS